MKRLPEKDVTIVPADDIAMLIWQDMVHSMGHYTSDSHLSSFYQPEQLIAEARLMAASFTLLHYSPLPDIEEVYKSRLYALLFVSIICGVQIFVKERALLKNHAPFTVLTGDKELRHAKNQVMRQLSEGMQVFSPTNQVMDIVLSQLFPMKERVKRGAKLQNFNEDLFAKFLPVTLAWGYFYANGVIIDKS